MPEATGGMAAQGGTQGAALRPELLELVAGLRALAGPAEQAFTGLGNDLGRALDMLSRLRGRFDGIAAELESGEASAAAAAMGEATRNCAELAAGVAATGGLLRQIDDDTRRAGAPLQALRSVIEEIGALAINAKMLVAQIRTDRVDFSVFTVEVGRLHGQAGAIVKQASDRLGSLVAVLAEAGQVNAETVAASSGGLAEAGAHLESALAGLAERQRLSLRSVAGTGELSQGIADRVGQCIGELQVNDMTIQRIEHAWRGLDLAAGILDGSHAWPEGPDRPAPAAGARCGLAAEVCRLQAMQLGRARDDFLAEVEALKTNLRGLAASAAGIVTQAASVVGDGDDGASFAADLHRHGRQATGLLGSYSDAQRQLQRLLTAAAGDLDGLSADIARIQSIDEDMRLMGLNATLKCSRLGDEGRALGVVAQELRACSRRTEELARPVSEAIAATGAASGRLTALAAAEQSRAAQLSQSLEASLRSLAGLDATLGAALAALRADSEAVAGLLGAAAGELVIDREIAATLGRAAERASGLADRLAGDAAAPEAARAEVLRVLAGRYTMASERAVHDRFAGGAAEPAAAAGDDGSLDELFF